MYGHTNVTLDVRQETCLKVDPYSLGVFVLSTEGAPEGSEVYVVVEWANAPEGPWVSINGYQLGSDGSGRWVFRGDPSMVAFINPGEYVRARACEAENFPGKIIAHYSGMWYQDRPLKCGCCGNEIERIGPPDVVTGERQWICHDCKPAYLEREGKKS